MLTSHQDSIKCSKSNSFREDVLAPLTTFPAPQRDAAAATKIYLKLSLGSKERILSWREKGAGKGPGRGGFVSEKETTKDSCVIKKGMKDALTKFIDLNRGWKTSTI